jgi:hypothetical protein
MTPGCQIVHENGKALVLAMKSALANADMTAAELVACDCVVLAETKDHANWELIGACAKELEGELATTLQEAYDEVEDQEDEHLYHTKGWCRELWRRSLGLTAASGRDAARDHGSGSGGSQGAGALRRAATALIGAGWPGQARHSARLPWPHRR